MVKKEERKFLVAIELLGTGTEVIVFDFDGVIKGRSFNAINQFYPAEGLVEINANDIWRSALNTMSEALSKGGIYYDEVGAIGIASQHNIVVAWDRKTGEPLCNAVAHRCLRGSRLCQEFVRKGEEPEIKKRTGLHLSPEHAGFKIGWLLDRIPGLRKRALKGEVAFGGIETWVLWKMTEGKAHLTDYTNASRTMLFNIKTLAWDPYLLKKLDIPKSVLPEVRPSAAGFGATERYGNLVEGIPIGAMATLDQSSMVGLGIVDKGVCRVNYGDGARCIEFIGGGLKIAKGPFQTLLACGRDKAPLYAMEAKIVSAGVDSGWVRDNLKLINALSETDEISERAAGGAGLYLVPAFGPGNPYHTGAFAGAMLGLHGGITKDHVVRASLEALSYQTKDLIDLLGKEAGTPIKGLMADGSSSKNNFLMQFVANLLGQKLNRPPIQEVSALGIGFLAGLAAKHFRQMQDIHKIAKNDKVFSPSITAQERAAMIKGWTRAVKTAIAHNG